MKDWIIVENRSYAKKDHAFRFIGTEADVRKLLLTLPHIREGEDEWSRLPEDNDDIHDDEGVLSAFCKGKDDYIIRFTAYPFDTLEIINSAACQQILESYVQ